jgi:UPF0755 protein
MAVVTAIAVLVLTPATLLDDEPGRKGPVAQPDELVMVTIPEGADADTIGENLEDAGAIESGVLFQALVALMEVEDELSAGEYEFSRGETALAAIDRIRRGQTAPLTVTVPEGLRYEEIGELLEEAGVVTADEFAEAVHQRDYFSPAVGATPPGQSLEGFLFPATYGFSRAATGHDVVQEMLTAFEEQALPTIPAAGRFSRPLREVITIASIVEREAQLPEERPLIASVLLNRLAIGMPLQADPTVQYAIANDPASVEQYGWWKAELSLTDLLTPSPYNTYVNLGLPPGPIANPGLASIEAVVRPAQTSYLYFVARPDGSHVFAQTLEEHNRNVCQLDPARPECGGGP